MTAKLFNLLNESIWVYRKVSRALIDLFEIFSIGGQKLKKFVDDLWKKIAEWFVKNKKLINPRYDEVADITAKELDWMVSRNIGSPGGNILKETQIRKLRGILKNKGVTGYAKNSNSPQFANNLKVYNLEKNNPNYPSSKT